MNEKQPAEIAREALMQLSARKLLPTPANYQASYNEIAHLPNVAGFPEAPMRQIAQALTPRNPEQAKQLGLLDAAIGRRSWREVQDALVAFAGSAHAGASRAEHADPATSPTNEDCLKSLAQMIENIAPALGDDDEHFLR